MNTSAIAETGKLDVLAYEALDGVIKAHASLDALAAQSPEELQAKIRHVHALITRSAREINDIVRWIEYCSLARRRDHAEDGAVLSRRTI